jgi:hypothetical protein
MNYLVYEVDVGPLDVVEVTLDKQANVRLMDASNYQSYRSGRAHRYYGGLAKTSPLRLRAPSSGHWYVAVDLGGYAGTVRASVRVIKGG